MKKKVKKMLGTANEIRVYHVSGSIEKQINHWLTANPTAAIIDIKFGCNADEALIIYKPGQ